MRLGSLRYMNPKGNFKYDLATLRRQKVNLVSESSPITLIKLPWETFQ